MPDNNAIDALEQEIKEAFNNEKFDRVKVLATKLKALDPGSHFADRMLEKIQISLPLKTSLKNKPGLFSRLFQKKEKSAPIRSPLKTPPHPLINPFSQVKIIPSQESENNFTRMFGKKDARPQNNPKKSIIESIVSRSELTEKSNEKLKEVEKKKDLICAGLLKFSRALLQFSIAFIVLSSVFFYAQNIDSENRIFNVLHLGDNYAIRMHNTAIDIKKQKADEIEINKELDLYDQGYTNRHEKIVEDIVKSRINWPDILNKINEITDSVYERNALSQYVQYDSFSFDIEKGVVRVSGKLSDPLGKNLTKLAEIEEAFRFFPGRKGDPDQPIAPYFYDVKELSSLRKSFDRRSGKYESTFNLSFSLNSVPEK
jgi:hypothetical protein